MVARQPRLTNGDFHPPQDAGEQDRALDLRARDLVEPVDTVKRPTAHGHRESVRSFELDDSPHGLERSRHASHRAPTETPVSDEAGRDTGSGDDACEEARRRAAVAALERVTRRKEAG